MSITLRQLQYLIAVAEHRSFTRAASALYVSQPALSQQLSRLEHTLQIKLLERTPRDVRLTPAGRLYVAHATRALGELDGASRALHEFDDLSRGEVRIGLIPPALVLIGPDLVAFNDRYPGVQLILMEKDQEDIHANLDDGLLDLGVGFDMAPQRSSAHPSLATAPLRRPTLSFLVGPNHPLFERTVPLGLGELVDERVVLLSRRFALRQHIDEYCAEHGLSLQISMEVDSITMLSEAVLRGAPGTFCFDALTQGGQLASLPVDPPLTTPMVQLLYRRDVTFSNATRALVATLSNHEEARRVDGSERTA